MSATTVLAAAGLHARRVAGIAQARELLERGQWLGGL
jgi:hypothetical protein